MYLKYLAGLQGALAALLLTGVCATVAAQDRESESTDDGTVESSSREVDINEDNYRRFMELKDPRLERPAFPTAKVQPNAGLEKMSQLPEDSQKHLRNELREIISATGPWTPAERQRSYRFTPSKAAQKDGQLLRQEMEAWVELVGEYHAREAAIMNGRLAGDSNAPQDSSGLPALGAGGQAPESSANPGTGTGTAQQNQDGSLAQGSNLGQAAGGNPGQEGQQGQQQQQGQQGSGTGSEGSGAQQSASQSNNAAGQESSSDPQRRRVAIPDTGPAYSAPEPGPSNAGVSQSALEFLAVQGRVTIPEPSPTPAVETPKQPAPKIQAAPPPEAPAAGSLSLEELRNARGLTAGPQASLEMTADAAEIAPSSTADGQETAEETEVEEQPEETRSRADADDG
jgi:hypothetical protein